MSDRIGSSSTSATQHIHSRIDEVPIEEGPSGGQIRRAASPVPEQLSGLSRRATRTAETHRASNAPANSPEKLSELIAKYFEHHRTDTNNADLDAIIADRSQTLHEMGETAASVHTVFERANRMDILSNAAAGLLGSVPFGAATLALDAAPALTGFAKTPFQSGTASGVISHIFDAAGGKLLEEAVSNTQWLDGSTGKLTPVMADAKKTTEPSTVRSHTEHAAAIQTFTGRNILRTAVNTALTAQGKEKAAGDVDVWIAGAGSPVAGAAYKVVMHQLSKSNHRVGPEFLLGQEDWVAKFNEVKSATWTGAIANGAGRLARIPFAAATNAAKAAQSLFEPSNLAKGAALGVGFGAVEVAVTAAAKHATEHHVSKAGTAATKQIVQTAASAGVFPVWTSASLATDALAAKAGAAVEAVGMHAASAVSAATSSTIHSLGRAESAVAQGVADASGFVSRQVGNAADATTRTLGDAARGIRQRIANSSAPTEEFGLDDLRTQLAQNPRA
jgi:hypothetical protein